MKHGTRIIILFISALVLIFGLVAVVMLNQRKTESWEPVYSTRFTDPFGTHALYRLLESQGYSLEKNFFSFEKMPEKDFENLVLIAPKEFLSDTEEIVLKQKIENGSWAIIVGTDGNNPMQTFGMVKEIEKVGPEVNTWNKKDSVFAAIPDPGLPVMDSVQFIRKEVVGIPNFIRNRKINTHFTHHLRSDSFAIHPFIQSRKGEIEAGWFRFGEGGVIFTTHPYIFTNEGLRNPANVQLVMHFFGRIKEMNPETFVFDEYHQGFHVEKIASPIWIPQVRWMIWGLFATFLLAIFTGMKRKIKTVPVTREPRRSILEFISSMAEIYSRKNGHHSIFMEICFRFVTRTKAALGISATDIVKNPAIAVKAAALKWEKSESEKLSEILREIRMAYLDKKPSLSLARKMREFAIRNKLDLNIHVK